MRMSSIVINDAAGLRYLICQLAPRILDIYFVARANRRRVTGYRRFYL